MRASDADVGDYVYVDYMKRGGTIIEDRGGRVGRWKVKLDDGRICYASSRDLIVEIPAEDEDDPIVMVKAKKVDPIDWEKKSKESLQNILKKYNK